MNRRFMLIGGGQMFVPCKSPTTLAIDEEIVGMTTHRVRGRRPRVLFIPTAAYDDISYCHGVHVEFELRLGCDYKHLRIEADQLSQQEIHRRIRWADIIYVGGGNTAHLMQVWKEQGLDLLLLKAAAAGKTLAGLSAGSICWFSAGLSDLGKKPTEAVFYPQRVEGLGLIPLVHSPHWDSEFSWRHAAMREMLDRDEAAVVLEDDAALQIINDRWRIVASQPGKCGYKLVWSGTDLISFPLEPTQTFRPLHELIGL